MTKKVVWKALDGNQGLALNCPCNHILLHGTRGSGKSDVQLMFFRRYVGQGYGHAWRGIIFDREYKNLEDLIAKSRRWFPQFNDGARFLANNSQLKWIWPTGEELFFRTLAKEEDYWRYHGHEYCLAEGEKVPLRGGHTPIERVKVGDEVLTPAGYKKVTRTYDIGLKDCVKVEGDGVSTTCSITHKCLNSDMEWVRLSDKAAHRLNVRGVGRALPYSIPHPYRNGENFNSDCALTEVIVSVTPHGKLRCYDIEVEDVNCYFTTDGLINKNSFIGHNELTKNPSPNLYDMIMSCNRTSFIPEENPVKMSDGSVKILPEIPLVVLSTTNPYGVGRNWVKQKFIDKAESGEIYYKEAEIFNPRTQTEMVIRKSFVHLFMSYKDNKYLSPEYILELESISDPNKRKAWLEGDWDITSGGMFDDVFRTRFNVVKPFNIPRSWKIFRSFDWGSSKPFSVGWWAESDGSDYVADDGSYHSTVRGDLFRIGEWYGWNGEANVGLRMLNVEIATNIVKREISMGIYNDVVAGPADNSVNDVIDGKSIAMQMSKPVMIDGKQYRGVTWTKSNKKAGSRKLGWELMRQGFANAVPDEGSLIRDKPAIFTFSTCQDGFIRTVPSIPRDLKDPDDVADASEDHCADESRYAILDTGIRFANDRNRVLGHY